MSRQGHVDVLKLGSLHTYFFIDLNKTITPLESFKRLVRMPILNYCSNIVSDVQYTKVALTQPIGIIGHLLIAYNKDKPVTLIFCLSGAICVIYLCSYFIFDNYN